MLRTYLLTVSLLLTSACQLYTGDDDDAAQADAAVTADPPHERSPNVGDDMIDTDVLPTCAELGCPDSAFCNAAGVCSCLVGGEAVSCRRGDTTHPPNPIDPCTTCVGSSCATCTDAGVDAL